MKKFNTVEEYISSFPHDVQKILKEYRKVIKNVVPKAEEKIGYGIPTYKLNGKNLIHFGGFEKHTSLFPGPEAIQVFSKDLKAYETSKGTIKFPLSKPVPFELIKKIAEYKVGKYTH